MWWAADTQTDKQRALPLSLQSYPAPHLQCAILPGCNHIQEPSSHYGKDRAELAGVVGPHSYSLTYLYT